MDFFDLLKMVGGLALFLYGMNLLVMDCPRHPADVWSVSWRN